MKKLFVLALVLFVLSGCDNGETKTLSCTSSVRENGMVNKTKYDFNYMNDEIKHVTITYDYKQEEDVDGVNSDTDGLDEDNDNDANVDSDEVVDGVVGDAIDETVGTITDTILDIAGIRNRFENQMDTYDDIEGFTYEVDTDNDSEYRVIYKIDMDKISDDDLSRFNLDRNFNNITDNYEDLGYTCQ